MPDISNDLKIKKTRPERITNGFRHIRNRLAFKQIAFFSLLLFASSFVLAQPFIQQFSPLSAIPGSSVTIQGTGFSTNPSGNQVFFGAIRGTVTAATSNALVATVPVGATPGPIIVTVAGLSAYSRTDFQPKSSTIYPLDGGAFKIEDTAKTGYYPRNALFSDLDLDGKPDLLVLRYEPNQTYQNHIMPFRNESEPNGEIVLKPQGSFEAGIFATDMAIGDFDGDGKQDAVVTSLGNISSQLKVLRNTSSIGSISFANVTSFTITGSPNYVVTGDADGDGKIDIIVSDFFDGKLLIYRNTSSTGTISFAPPAMIEAGASAGMMAFADFNGDGKRDIAVTNELIRRVVVFSNNSSPGSVSFVQARIIELPNSPKVENIVAADLNSDGKNELLITTGNAFGSSGAFFVYTNTGDFTFSSLKVIQHPNFSGAYFKPSVGDLNGDGKPDVVLGLAGEAKFGVYQNFGEIGGAINLQFAEDWICLDPTSIAIGDLNADGKPELAIGSFSNQTGVLVFGNNMGQLSISNVSPSFAGQGAEVTITGYNFTGITSVTFGNTPAASFKVESSNIIKAKVGAGASGRVEVTGETGTDYWEEFFFDNRPVINAFAPKIAVAGDTVVINGKNFIGTFKITFGGVPAKSYTLENDSTIKAIVDYGATGDIAVYTPGGIAFLGGFIFPPKPKIYSFGPNKSGTVGDNFSISGQNLTFPGLETTVTIGGVPAIITESSSFYLNVTVGFGASGYVAVFHKGGVDSMSGFSFIPPPPAPVIHSVSSLIGQPGDTILVTGRYFTGLTEFFFGDAAAAYFQVVNDSMVQAVVNHGTTGPIKAVTPWGFTSFAGFTFVQPPAPVIFTISPQEGITGTLVELSGDNFYGIVSASMGTAYINNIIENSRKKFSFYVPLGANGPVSITTKYGTGVQQQPLFTVWQPPKLHSFSPLTAQPNETVTINGSGFGSDDNLVKVYFGHIEAKIISLQPNKIVVEVPQAAGFDFIRVNARNLSVVSERKFNRSNKSTAGFNLKETLFEKRQMYQNPEASTDAHKLISADFNNDGLIDFVMLSQYKVRLFKNVSTKGNVEFLEGENIALSWTDFRSAEATDIDGDGKTDLILVNLTEILRNVSTPDEIKFEIIPGFLIFANAVKDFNQDGKPDLISKQRDRITVTLNNSSPGKILLEDTISFIIPTPATGLYKDRIYMQNWELLGVTDLDSDGLYDFIFRFMHELFIVRNSGTLATPAFDSVITISLERAAPDGRRLYPIKVLLDDLNQDGKPDLTFLQHFYNADYCIFRNTSTPGKISLGPLQLFSHGPLNAIQFADFNGDDKPDLVSAYEKTIYLFQNKSTKDSIMLDFAFSTNGAQMVFNVADFDADGKTDILFFNHPPFEFRNRLNDDFKLSICPNSNVTMQANFESSAYQWQMNTGNGYLDISNGGIISGAQTSSLTLTNVPSSWVNRTFRCRLANGTFSEPYLIQFANTWNGSQTSDWHNPNNWSCGMVPDEHTIVTIPYGQYIEVKNNATCRSIIAQFNTQINILPGVQLIITGE